MLRKEGMEPPARYHTQSILAVPILAEDTMGESEDGKPNTSHAAISGRRTRLRGRGSGGVDGRPRVASRAGAGFPTSKRGGAKQLRRHLASAM